MKTLNTFKFVAIGLAIVGGLLALSLIYPTSPSSGQNGPLALQAPAFIDEAHAQANDLQPITDEAGISAYFKVNTINLATVRELYRTVETDNSTYIIGSMEVPGYTNEVHDTHVYIHVDGWVVAYFI